MILVAAVAAAEELFKRENEGVPDDLIAEGTALITDTLSNGRAAVALYRSAAARTASMPERHYLTTRAARLA